MQIRMGTFVNCVDVLWEGHMETEVGFWNRWKCRYLLLCRMQTERRVPDGDGKEQVEQLDHLPVEVHATLLESYQSRACLTYSPTGVAHVVCRGHGISSCAYLIGNYRPPKRCMVPRSSRTSFHCQPFPTAR
jgi:hypothetical protein